MDEETFISTVTQEIDEIVTPDELKALYGKKELKAYVGIEPSGFLHIGHARNAVV